MPIIPCDFCDKPHIISASYCLEERQPDGGMKLIPQCSAHVCDDHRTRFEEAQMMARKRMEFLGLPTNKKVKIGEKPA